MDFRDIFFEMSGAFKRLAFELGCCGAYAPAELNEPIVNEATFNEFNSQTSLLVTTLCGDFCEPSDLRQDHEFLHSLTWVQQFLATLKLRLQHWWNADCPILSRMVELTRTAIDRLQAFEPHLGLASAPA